jgi:glycosyltransferase involved in cell wall biosynthesis
VTSSAPGLRIGLSLGNIGALHDGLGEFALQVGTRVAAQAPAWREAYGIGIDFHLKDRFFDLFGSEVGYLGVHRWQRLRHEQPRPYALWHTLHQLSKNLPPSFHGRRTPMRLVTVHDLNYRVGRNAWSTWRHHRRTQALLARTDAMAAISQYTADEVRRHLNWTQPIEVIHNGARSFVTAPREPLPGWAATAERPFLFHLSRMSPSKNPQSLIELARRWPEMTFVMCGPPSDDAKQLRRTVQLPNLQFHLGISDAHKAWAYSQCTAFLFPSLTEGFGLPPIEAMHFGKPTFLARRSCLPEIGGDAAEYFDDFAPGAMRGVIEHGLLRHDREQRAGFVQAHAAQFDWDVCAAGYLDLYRRLLKLPPR